jgi:ABC-2 type transport system ATP-binding protein
MVTVEARQLRLCYQNTVALDGIDLAVDEGRILGIIGPNGAGKTSLFNAILGFVPHEGELSVLGLDPWTKRDRLMADATFISDVAVLPRWTKVSQALDYVAGVHPRFDRAKADAFLEKTTIRRNARVSELSKGMVTQLHLALVMAIDTKLLVLDEPTLGLDLIYRKAFYDELLGDYLEHNRTILVATHQVEEIQNVLTDFVFLDRGRIVLTASMTEFESRFAEALVGPGCLEQARRLHPVSEKTVLGRTVFLFDGVEREKLATLGEVRTPSLADLFLSVVGHAEDPRA